MDYQAQYEERKDALAEAILELERAHTGWECFGEKEKAFDRLEKAVQAVSYSINLLSFARRALKKSLAKKEESL